MKKFCTKIKGFLILSVFASMLFATSSFAVLKLELTSGVDARIPLAIIPFSEPGNLQPSVSDVINNDFKTSSQFILANTSDPQHQPHLLADIDYSYWQSQKIEYIVLGRIAPLDNNRYRVTVFLVDTFNHGVSNKDMPPALIQQQFTVSQDQLQTLGHYASNLIYQKITGDPGIFQTKIAYINVVPNPNAQSADVKSDNGQVKKSGILGFFGKKLNQPGKNAASSLQNKNKYQLIIADYNGDNPQVLLTSTQPMMSPSWSPDGKQIAYVSFDHYQSAVYTVDLATGKRTKVTSYPGINGAPSWSPEGHRLAVVLSNVPNGSVSSNPQGASSQRPGGGDGSSSQALSNNKGRVSSSSRPKIFIVNLNTNQLQQVTTGNSIDTEPSWAPDGQSILFTSNRVGSPQIFSVDIASGKVSQQTFDGRYNAHASYVPGQPEIAFAHRDDSLFTIATQNLDTGDLNVITKPGYNESPSVAPNGQMIVYAASQNGRGTLHAVSTDGSIQLTIPSGNAQAPAWSPFLG